MAPLGERDAVEYIPITGEVKPRPARQLDDRLRNSQAQDVAAEKSQWRRLRPVMPLLLSCGATRATKSGLPLVVRAERPATPFERVESCPAIFETASAKSTSPTSRGTSNSCSTRWSMTTSNSQ